MPLPVEQQKVIQEAVKEHEHLVVDGMDISGHWNRMFGQRVIFDYSHENLAKVTDVPGDVFDRMLRTNTTGPLLVTQAFWPFLKKAQGRVVNVSSGAGALNDIVVIHQFLF